jgi:hypothetical protein
MKHLVSALAMLSLFAAAPALASDISSDRQFAETKAMQSVRPTTEAQSHDPRQVNKLPCACSCSRGSDPQVTRGEPGGH